MKTLTIIIPVYNEKDTILEILKQVEAVELPLNKEIVIIDDKSIDGTREILINLDQTKYKIFYQEKNQGKGAAITRGFKEGSGDIFIIQDADLEYDPEDYKAVLEPILSGRADVVYGSRFSSKPHRILFFWHSIGNKLLTFVSNIFTNLNLSDMETCYKAFRKEVVDSFKDKLESKRFGIEPELTARIAKKGWCIYEVGISYFGRTYDEGKKINWKDGVAAFWHIVKFNLIKK
jgi:glycosyltransferase involved in cell wall biosynthesis